MAQVPQKTLSWLWSVLQPEYRDAQRAYGDAAQVLAVYPSLAPRTNAYTFDNGSSALLLKLSGTIPVSYRGAEYRFPVTIWLPHTYPLDPPLVFVTPTNDLAVRPGQHVSGADGKIYHPYLARWREAPDRYSLAEFTKILVDVFAREPPVMSRQQQQQQQQQQPIAPSQPVHRASDFRQPQPQPQPQSPQPPPRPPLPGQQPVTSTGPPPPPPKPYEQVNGPRPGSTVAQREHPSPRTSRYDAPPPLPAPGPPSRPVSMVASPPPPLPPPESLQRQHQSQQPYPSSARNSYPPQHLQQPTPQYVQHPPAQRDTSTYAAPPQTSMPPQPPPAMSAPRYPPPQQHPPPMNQPLPHQPQFQPQPQRQPVQFQPQPQPPPQKKPDQPNLMDESPFDINLSSANANLPTPAIPPNPEKQQILQALQSALLGNLHSQINQSSSALAPLQSQQNALSSAQYTLQQELDALQALQSSLQSNISSLSSTIAAADRTVASAKSSSSPDNIPPVDDMIIAPTVVARQLYDSVADQRGYEAAIYALTEAFVRGRIGGELWSRKTRECAREEFRRKYLVKRIGRGMGLDISA